MRKLIDALFEFLLRISASYLYKYYDLFLDGVEVWISEKVPSIGDVLEDIEDIYIEE